jgi:hypothetical protein
VADSSSDSRMRQNLSTSSASNPLDTSLKKAAFLGSKLKLSLGKTCSEEKRNKEHPIMN